MTSLITFEPSIGLDHLSVERVGQPLRFSLCSGPKNGEVDLLTRASQKISVHRTYKALLVFLWWNHSYLLILAI
jgi:hypothetical protein